jgi:uncharacterized membrane protein
MKRFRNFVEDALISGALFLFPAYLCLLLLIKSMHALGKLLRPLTRVLPAWFPAEQVFSILIVLSICFVVGLVLRTRFGLAMRQRIENCLFRKIPGYQLFRGLIEQLAGQSQEQVWKPVLAEIEEAFVPAFIIEEFEDGRFTVFVPSVPTPLAGSIYILDGNRVYPLNITFAQAIKALSQWGSGYRNFIGSMKLEKRGSPQDARFPAGTREALVKMDGDICSMCGVRITAADRETYWEAQRCGHCHDELDTANGPISAL